MAQYPKDWDTLTPGDLDTIEALQDDVVAKGQQLIIFGKHITQMEALLIRCTEVEGLGTLLRREIYRVIGEHKELCLAHGLLSVEHPNNQLNNIEVEITESELFE